MFMAKIQVKDTEVSVVRFRDEDYISLTDMVRKIENGLALIEKWLRNKNTIEFLGTWEEVYNPDFNSPEFEGIRNSAGAPNANSPRSTITSIRRLLADI